MFSLARLRSCTGAARVAGDNFAPYSERFMAPRLCTWFFPLIAALWALTATSGSLAGEHNGGTCVDCHAAERGGFNPAHAFAAANCVNCHAGDDTAPAENTSHRGLVLSPGDLAHAARSCGNCHADKVASVTKNLMHTGRGIVDVTRRLIDGSSGPENTVNFQSLGHGVADSLLRKQCASCHLGQQKNRQENDELHARGGGCLACHAGDGPENSHPALTARVSDARCFGCHSRSGRISLSYAGLAEVAAAKAPSGAPVLRLSDGRSVERKPADVHYLAGMSCIDCHTSAGLMGAAGSSQHQREAVDIACSDCHRDAAADEGTRDFVTAKKGTALPHIEVRDNAVWLHTKVTGRTLLVPLPDPANHAENSDHKRLECASCHSQWAPQCFGCHMNYDAEGQQWDHVENRETPGQWREQRSDIQSGLAALGVNQQGRIELFVPGMIMTIAHPDWEVDKFVRVFGALSPHTTGASRSCESCHRSSRALGLGQGELTHSAGTMHFTPSQPRLQDGLPADAWTNMERSLGGLGPVEGQRPLSTAEMRAILNAAID